MPSDKELYLKHKHNGFTARQLAEDYGLSEDSVRGRLSRSSRDRTAKIGLLHYLTTEVPQRDVSVQRQLDTISNAPMPSTGVGLFITDAHFPHVRLDAVELSLQLAEFIQPDLIVGLSDAIDHAGFGRWPDDRSARERLWYADYQRVYDTLGEFYGLFKGAAPSARFPVLWGNHDLWVIDRIKGMADGMANRIIADWLEQFVNMGLEIRALPERQNWLRISPTLVWTHGSFSNKMLSATAKSHVEQAMVEFGTRTSMDVVHGHNHRAGQTLVGKGSGRSQVTSVPSLCRPVHPYNKYDPGATLGCAVSYWDEDSSSTKLVEFIEQGDELVTEFNGRVFRTTRHDNR